MPDSSGDPGGSDSIAPTLAASFVELLDVQFWQIGRDVEHPDGNLLVRLGFTRTTQPGDPRTPGRYQRQDGAAGHTSVFLWRCGLYLGSVEHAVLLVRGRRPRVVHVYPDDVYDQDEVWALHAAGSPCSCTELREASVWLADYEASVEQLAGVAHRQPKPGPRPTLAPATPCSLRPQWHALADALSPRPRRARR